MTAAPKLEPRAIDPGVYYTPKQAAEALQCSIEKLSLLRSRGEPPRFRRWGRQIRYCGQDLIDCLEGRTTNTTTEDDDA